MSLIWFILHATSCNRVFKRCNMLHATMLDDVACNMLRSFERAFMTPLAQDVNTWPPTRGLCDRGLTEIELKSLVT